MPLFPFTPPFALTQPPQPLPPGYGLGARGRLRLPRRRQTLSYRPGAMQAMLPLTGLGATVRAGTLDQNGTGSAATSAIALANFVGSTVGGIAGAYHGYKRNDSVGWAIAWFILGGLFWPVALPIMYGQGFAKKKGR